MRATRIGKNGKPQISEADFTKQVIDLAHAHHWRVAHFRPAMNKKGEWRTAVQGDGAGFPDLILARARTVGRVVIFAELKTETGNMTDSQIMWYTLLPNCYLWRPSDYDEIERILK